MCMLSMIVMNINKNLGNKLLNLIYLGTYFLCTVYELECLQALTSGLTVNQNTRDFISCVSPPGFLISKGSSKNPFVIA